MAESKHNKLLIAILAGLILGSISGIIFAFISPENIVRIYALAVAVPLGTLFINLLKMIVTPVIIFTLISGTASIAPSKLGKVGVKIIVFYLLTSLAAIIVGIKYVPFSTIISIHSSSIIIPCSIDVIPALIAILIPPAPCA